MVAALGGMLGAGEGACRGESIVPLKTGKLVNGPGARPCAAGGAPTASQTLGSLPNGGAIEFVVTVEAAKIPKTLCVVGLTKTGPGLVFGKVEVGGRTSSDEVVPAVNTDQAKSSVKAAKRIASVVNSWSIK